MYIFIDETGSFTGIGANASISMVGALIVPDSRRGSLEREYNRMRPSLLKGGPEVKGRQLYEAQVAKLVPILRHHDVIFEVIAIDLGLHTTEGVTINQANRAAAMTNALTPEHSPASVEFAWSIRRELESHSLNLHIQSALTFVLIKRILEHGTLYWGQRNARELAAFHWVIDAKGEFNNPTAWERWWSKVVMPWMQTECHYHPLPAIKAANYSYMKRFYLTNPSPFQKELLGLAPDGPPPFDIKMIMTESFRFSSLPEPGLEMVDIITNATRRALVVNLQKPGWKDIPSLFIRRKEQQIEMASLDDSVKNRVKTSYAATLKQFDVGGRDMLTKKTRNGDW